MVSSFSVSVSFPADDVPTLRPAGELDVAAVAEMEQALTEAYERSATVQIDMQEVSFLDSTGLRLLLAARQRCQADGGRLLIANPQAETLRLLDLTGLAPLLLDAPA